MLDMQILPLLHTSISYLKQPGKRKWINLARSLKGLTGLEIGEPSTFFHTGKHLPVYLFANRVDVANYSSETVWEGTIQEGLNYNYFNNKKGYQYISEATDLNKVKDNTYDFVLSCHSLEHVANPIKALLEWKRILKPNGKLILILPYKSSTFDSKRPFTTFKHLLDDYHNNISETDTTHFEEIVALHDTSKHPEFVSQAVFEQLLADNYKNRCAHHHVFNMEVVKEILNYAGFSVTEQEIIHHFHLTTFAQRNN